MDIYSFSARSHINNITTLFADRLLLFAEHLHLILIFSVLDSLNVFVELLAVLYYRLTPLFTERILCQKIVLVHLSIGMPFDRVNRHVLVLGPIY